MDRILNLGFALSMTTVGLSLIDISLGPCLFSPRSRNPVHRSHRRHHRHRKHLFLGAPVALPGILGPLGIPVL